MCKNSTISENNQIDERNRLTGKAAQQINILIFNSRKDVQSISEALQDQVKDVTQSVEAGKEVSRKSLGTGRNVDNIFRKITVEIQEILEKINGIVEATFEQSKGLNQISIALNELQDLTEKNSESANSNLMEANHLKENSINLENCENEMATVIFGQKFGPKDPTEKLPVNAA